MSDIVVGLDIGTCNVRVVIGTHDENGRLQIIGVGTAPSTGLSRGVIVNIENTMNAVTTAIEAAELMGGCEVHSCYVGIGSTQVESLNSNAIFFSLLNLYFFAETSFKMSISCEVSFNSGGRNLKAVALLNGVCFIKRLIDCTAHIFAVFD